MCHVTFSTHGGAGQVAERLLNGRLKAGAKTRLVKITDRDVRSLILSNPLLFLSALIDFYLVRKTRLSQLFSLYRTRSSNRIVSEIGFSGEILHLHWIPGVLSFREIGEISKIKTGIVWSIQDMWPFTGGCHHALDCDGYLNQCASCPQVRKPFQFSVSRNLANKIESLNSGSGISVVVPSKWMAANVSRSRVFAESKLYVIPNPVDCDIFVNKGSGEERINLGIAKDAFVVGCSATNLGDQMKNIDAVARAVSEFSRGEPTREIVLLAMGGGQLASSGVSTVITGSLRESTKIAAAYRAMDIFVTMSLAETFGLTLAEAAASGVPTICLNRGGMPDVVIHGRTGLVIDDQNDLVGALQQLYEDVQLRHTMAENARTHALSQFSIESIVEQYEHVYAGIGGGR